MFRTARIMGKLLTEEQPGNTDFIVQRPITAFFADGYIDEVPVGAHTDFASCRIFNGIISFLPTRVANSPAAVFHDRWYRDQILPFLEANWRFAWLLVATRVKQRDIFWAIIAWLGVTLFGWPTYLKYYYAKHNRAKRGEKKNQQGAKTGVQGQREG